jgi:hypothetical protein
MANMGYCRFENTFQDLQECEQHLNDELSEEEEQYRKWLIEVCKKIAESEDN